jgi:pimeloyl-ACP methyl ester carboxylesterase
MDDPAYERATIAGREIELLRRGRGRPLLYLHAGDGIEPSLGFVERLSRSFKVTAASHPGFGASPRHGFRDVHDLAYHYLDLIDVLGLDHPVVVGASFGGWIAAEMAIRAPERLGALVLIDAVGIKTTPPDQREIADLFSFTPQALNDLVYKRPPPVAAPSDLDAARRIAANQEALSRYAWSPTLHNPRLARWLHRITTPTLVVWGAEDRVVAPDYGRAYARAIPLAKFKLVEDAGHFPEREQTETVARAVEEFAGASTAVPA